MEKQAEPPVKVYPLWVRAETPFDYENPVHVDRVMNEFGGTMGMNEYMQTEKEVKEGNWSKIEDPRFVAALKKLGFDSLYVKENRTKNLAVFSANQVKSVTGNIGEFGENKDIRYSLPTQPNWHQRQSGWKNKYADKIVDGEKTYETRESDSLKRFWVSGDRVAIVRTGEGTAKAIGEVTIGKPIIVRGQKNLISTEARL
jgi:hypothetical protein